MKKTTLLKTLFMAVGLCMGGSAWATDVPYTIGSTTSNWETEGSYSDSYTLAAGKTLTFTFTVNESAAASEGEDWKGYLAVIQESSTRHTLNANTYTFVRSMCDYNVKGEWGIGAIYNTNTYPSGAKYSHFVGADVTMTIKRISTYVLITTAITKSETTYYHYYQQNLGTKNDLYAFLCADYAELTLKGVTTTDNGLTEETYDFTSASPASSWGCSSAGSVTVDGSSLQILENDYFDMKGRFAGGTKDGGVSYWYIARNNSGLLEGSGNSSKDFAILNLTAGDYVTIKYSDNGSTYTFEGAHNITGLTAGTSIVSEQIYEIKSTGNLLIRCAKKDKSNNPYISSIIIATSNPVLERPTIKFNSMVATEGLYYPKVTIESSDDGVTFKNGSGETITSPYTFTGTGTLTVYTVKAGRTNSAKRTYTVENGWILAKSVNCKALEGTIDYASGIVYTSGRFDNIDDQGTAFWKQLVPGLEFNSTYWYASSSNGIYAGSGSRTVSCTVLNSNRMATLKHYDYDISAEKYDYLTSSSNSTTIKRQSSPSKNDYLREYNLYVSPSEEVSVTIGSTGYSTFSSPVPLNFSGVDGLTAFVATTVGGGTVTLSPVTTAPANTGLVLKGTAGATYNIPVTNSAATPASNLLVGCIVNTTVAADATSGFNNYVLVNEDGTPKFQSLVVNGATIPAGKAFLKNGAHSLDARSLNIVFDEETTGINAVNDEGLTVNGFVYDLQGRRVAQPTKGLYIKNGKKVIMK